MQATRRGFLRGLGAVFAAIPAVKLLPLLPAAAPPSVFPLTAPVTTSTFLYGKEAVIGQWADYISFGSFALSDSVTPQLDHLADEMAHRMGYTVSLLASKPNHRGPTFQFPNRKVVPTKEAIFS